MSGIIRRAGSKSGTIGKVHGTMGQIIHHWDNSTNCEASGIIMTTTAGSGWRATSKALIIWSGDVYTTGAAGNTETVYITGSGFGSGTSGMASIKSSGYYTDGYMYVPHSGQALSTAVGTTTPSFGLYCDQASRTDRYQWNYTTIVAIEIFQGDNNIQRTDSF